MRNAWVMCFLVLVWAGFSNNFSAANLLLGACVSIACCFMIKPKQQSNGPYDIRPWPILVLLGFVLIELVKSSLMVAWDVITPKHLSNPKIIDINLDCRHDAERTLLANLISLTPGTLSIDLSEDKQKLKVHVMFADVPEQIIRHIKQDLEPQVLKVFKYAHT